MKLRWLQVRNEKPTTDAIRAYRNRSGLGVIQTVNILENATKLVLQQEVDGVWVDVPFVVEYRETPVYDVPEHMQPEKSFNNGTQQRGD